MIAIRDPQKATRQLMPADEPTMPIRHTHPALDTERLERAVLCHLILNPTDLNTLSALGPAHFERPKHRYVFRAITDIVASGGVPNLVTLNDRLRDTGHLEDAGGVDSVQSILDEAPNAGGIEYLVTQLEEKRQKREIIATCQHGINLAKNGQPAEALRETLTLRLDETRGAEPEHVLQELDLEEFATRTDTTDWIVPGWLAAGTLNLMVARSHWGKSLIAAALAQAVARGSHWCGLGDIEPGPVVIVDHEQSEALCGEMYLRAGGAHPDLHLYNQPGIRLPSPDGGRLLRQLVDRHKPRLVIIDSVGTTLATGSTKDDDSARDYYRPIQDIKQDSGTAFMVLHHARKPSALGPKRITMEDVDGAHAWVDVPDSVWIGNEAREGRRVLEQSKNRPGEKQKMLIEFASNRSDPRIELVGLSVDDTEALSAQERAEQFVRDHLATGGQSSRSIITAAATEAGHSRTSIQRALSALTASGEVNKAGRGLYEIGGQA